MDLLSHAMYGVTVCSRTGLAGGRRGAGVRALRDRTVWWALGFGLIPDVVSMWIPFAVHAAAGPPGNFFHHFGGGWMTVYQLVHSLVPSLLTAALLWRFCRPLSIPSLAWTVHVLQDAVSHNDGKFQTLLFYPFSTWGIDGIPWWRHPWLLWLSWAGLPVIWAGLWAWRRKGRGCRLQDA